MLKGWFRVRAQGKSSFTVLSMMLALVVALSVLPSTALADPAPVSVSVSPNLSTVALETNRGIVTQDKVKVTGLINSNSTIVWSNYGKASAETIPAVGTSFSTISNIYTKNLNYNAFVPAADGDILSIVEVDAQSGEVLGYTNLPVGAIHIGTVAPMVDRNYVFPGIQAGYNQFLQGANFYNTPNGVTLSNFISSDTAIAFASPNGWYFYINGVSSGSASISFDAADNLTGDKIRTTIPVSVVSNRQPYLNDNEEYYFTGKALTLSVNPPTAQWVPDSIEVNGVAVPSESYTYTPGVIGQSDGKIVLQASVLSEGDNKIVVKTYDTIDGVYEITLHQSQHSYYMSEPLIDRASGGLNATVKFVRNIENNSYRDKSTVIFQLMNGDVPVDTVSVTTDRLNGYQTNRVHFNLADAATNPNYSVRAFLITGDNADPGNLGYNLVTEVNATEFEQRYQEWRDWD
ncbi:hypothetical protein BBD42_09495 [Paenibacillus sp. BIHB 4019]|uniref:Heme-binding protein Shr-like Hb-interacting domain-containing protein n=1 Tax=Paenibacillus sp. BIHB 4019 TaxID=1870819 RepID=A0A1B2DG19_9BACL|nr:hypothetical protein [Paenibacillus sp. BIHB 4019]ANY66668.1 hypothetical protein BBD42_09495 [Paenibacillus sp. BIHB 4019]